MKEKRNTNNNNAKAFHFHNQRIACEITIKIRRSHCVRPISNELCNLSNEKNERKSPKYTTYMHELVYTRLYLY